MKTKELINVFNSIDLNKPVSNLFPINSEEGSFNYELAFLLQGELENLQLYSELEKRKISFHPEKELNDLFIDLDFLTEFQKSLIQYYLPFRNQISSNLQLLENCLKTMLQQNISISETTPKKLEYEETSNTKLDQCSLDADFYLGGMYISPKTCIQITIGPLALDDLECFSAGEEKREFFEKAILPIFIDPYFDSDFEIIAEEEKKEEMVVQKDSEFNYLDMDILL